MNKCIWEKYVYINQLVSLVFANYQVKSLDKGIRYDSDDCNMIRVYTQYIKCKIIKKATSAKKIRHHQIIFIIIIIYYILYYIILFIII